MPKPPAILVKIIAWIITTVGPLLFLFSTWLLIASLVSEPGKETSIATMVGGYLIIVSLLMFSAGAVILNFKGSKIYKVILGTTIIMLILILFLGPLVV